MAIEFLHDHFAKDVGDAAAWGGGVGLVAGFVLGGLYSVYKPVDLVRWGALGAGLLATFLVAVVCFSYIWP